MSTNGPRKRLDLSNAVAFWLLTCLGLAVLAACVILPVYDRYLQVRAKDLQVQRQVAALEKKLAQLEFLAKATRNDPQYNEFLARNELSYRKPGQETVAVVPQPVATDGAKTVPGAADLHIPAGIRPGSWAYSTFINKRNRMILLIMAGACLAVAILVCNPAKAQAASGRAHFT